MKKIAILLLVGIFISTFLFLPFLFLLNSKLAYYVYKEFSYKVIINKLIGSEKDPEKIAWFFLDYLHNDLFSPEGVAVKDKDVYNDLIRGVAWCDQRSWALGTFLGILGIDNRMVMIRNHQGFSNHTVSEILINKNWRLFDPTFGFIIRKDSGEILSYDDICRDPSLFYLSPDMIKFKRINYNKYINIKNYFTKNIFYNNQTEPIIWNNPRKKRDFRYNMVTAILHFYIRIFGDRFAYLFQDVYLKYFSPSQESERLYFKARNYDLYYRYEVAINSYKTLTTNFPESPLSEDAIFFLGLLYHRNKELQKSIDMFNMLLEKYPNTKWQRIAHYFLGYNYELLNNVALAKDYYWRAIDMYNELGLEVLKPTELKVVRRLYHILDRENR